MDKLDGRTELFESIRYKADKAGRVPRFHGNGFTQLYIGEGLRLHVWSPDLPAIPDNNAAIHSHRYDVHSRVMAGYLKHTVYRFEEHEDGDMQCIVVGAAETKAQSTLTPVRRGFVHNIGTYIMGSGDYYEFPYPEFHTSDHVEDPIYHSPTVTVFRQHDEKAGRVPMVIAPWGATPTHAFAEAEVHVADMWKAIHKAILATGTSIAPYLKHGPEYDPETHDKG